MWWNKSKIAQSDNNEDAIEVDDTDLQYLEDEPRRKYGSGLEIIGHKFGHWTVISRVEPRLIVGNNKYNMFNIKCDCGVDHRATSYALSRGSTTMCKRCHIKDRKLNGIKFCR